jgi:hypothetical protein
MNTVTNVKPSLRLIDRLSFRLLVLFLGVFLLVFLALAAWSISWSFAESALANAGAVARPKPIVIDPKLRDELVAVMSLDTTSEPVSIKDPFADRTGIVGLSNAQRAVGGVVTTTGGPGSTTSSGTLATLDPSRQPGGKTGSQGGPAGPNSRIKGDPIPPSEATRQRYVEWLQRAALGDIPLDPRIFSVDDLLPVGVVDGGNGSQEVMFYSEAAGKTISFPVGTMFYDGWIAELRPEGVVFGSGSEIKQYRLRSWARSLRNVG